MWTLGLHPLRFPRSVVFGTVRFPQQASLLIEVADLSRFMDDHDAGIAMDVGRLCRTRENNNLQDANSIILKEENVRIRSCNQRIEFSRPS
jgi:hypothetical protein